MTNKELIQILDDKVNQFISENAKLKNKIQEQEVTLNEMHMQLLDRDMPVSQDNMKLRKENQALSYALCNMLNCVYYDRDGIRFWNIDALDLARETAIEVLGLKKKEGK